MKIITVRLPHSTLSADLSDLSGQPTVAEILTQICGPSGRDYYTLECYNLTVDGKPANHRTAVTESNDFISVVEKENYQRGN